MSPRAATLRATPDEEASRDRILDTAIELYARHGVSGVSLSLLADQVGLHKSTLFHHFATKDEIAHAALVRAVMPVCDRIERLAARRARPALDDLEATVLELDDHFAASPAAARFLLRAIVGPSEELDAHPDVELETHPVRRIFVALGSWLEAARRHGVVRPVRVRHALVDLLGLSLLYPALAQDLGQELFTGDPAAPRSRTARRHELAAHLRAAFAPA